MPAEGGIRFGQYVLLRRIARGGMAEVFLAQQRGLEGFDRRVAVKRILPHLADSPDFVRMFLGEAKLAAQLSHPNVVHIYDFGKVEHDYFIAMEYVDGVHAGQVFKQAEQHKLPPTLVARIGADAASALHYAHDLRGANGQPLGLVHRDVSPANIMISYDGIVKLCDFGIAKAAALSDQLTNPGQVKGKYAYMSPEQTIASQLDGRSDVFSLAIVLWELLAGKFIVPRGDAVDAMRAIRDGRLEPLSRAAPATPPPLVRAITWALEPKREQRATAAQLAEALEAFIKSSPELGTSMQLGAWIRQRFPREISEPVAALSPPAGAGTAVSPGTVASPGTMASPGTVIATGTQGPVARAPGGAPSKLAARLLEDRTGSFGGAFDEDGAPTIKRPPPPRRDEPTVIDDAASRRAAEEATLRDRDGHTSTVASIAGHDGRAATGVVAVMPTVIGPAPAPPAVPPSAPLVRPSGGQVMPRVPGSGPRGAPSVPTDPIARARLATPAGGTRRRGLRIVLPLAGLVALALISFVIALAASGGSHAGSGARDARTTAIAVTPLDAASVAAAPADAAPSADAAAVVAAPPDAAALTGFLEVRTVPPGGTIKVGDQIRTAPAQFVLAPGHVAVTAELPGYADEHREVDLEPEIHHEVEIAFTHKLPHEHEHGPALGKLTVRTTPYSDVYEGSHLVGTTPFADVPLAPGPHVLAFRNPKHATIEKKITIVAGHTLKLNFPLP